MADPLDPTGNPITAGRLTLFTPGLMGEAEAHLTGAAQMRSSALTSGPLEEALEQEEMETQDLVELTGTAELGAAGGTTRSTSWEEAAIEVQAPPPGGDRGQVLLAQDEAGVLTWNFAQGVDPVAATRGGSTNTYLVRRHVPQVDGGTASSRGILGAIGSKVLKVLVFKLMDEVAGAVADHFVGEWEKKKRSYRIRSFTPDDYAGEAAQVLDGDRDAWAHLNGGDEPKRALLFVHGTFSRTHAGFGALPKEFVEGLKADYDGRVFAFDHYTLSHDPLENVEEFVKRMPDGASVELDVVCHSRGGLVSRVMAEKQSAISLTSRGLTVRKIAFVATPNAGTVLADWKHIGDLIDRYTNLLSLFPDVGAVDVLQTVIAVVKQVAVGAGKGLDGLMAMRPDGPFLAGLNGDTDTQADYFALTSNFEPANPGLRDFVKDRLLDAVFDKENDLVVPTAGVYEHNGGSRFPIERHLSLSGADGVQHTGFFASPKVQDQLRQWLAA